MKIKPCPKCGCCEYLATAHVTQTWLINQDGDFVESKTECDEVLHAPDPDDMVVQLNSLRIHLMKSAISASIMRLTPRLSAGDIVPCSKTGCVCL